MRQDQNWLYSTNEDNTCRFVLGYQGERTLLCFGINPSTAEPNQLDNTMKSVDRLAKINAFDSWIMMNVYPERHTKPNDLPKTINHGHHLMNLKNIEEVFANKKVVIWAAWGTLIEKRPYLIDCLNEIYLISQKYNVKWVCIGKKSIKGHPHHPLYLRSDAPMHDFDMESYINMAAK